MYQISHHENSIVRLADGAAIPTDPLNGDYAAYLDWVAAGNTPAEADPEQPPIPSRDGRLLAAVEQAKEIVSSGGFSETQAAKLAAIFDGLGQAITGESS